MFEDWVQFLNKFKKVCSTAVKGDWKVVKISAVVDGPYIWNYIAAGGYWWFHIVVDES